MMGDFIGSLWWMIVAIGVLVTFHEYGHFIVARKLGVKVLRFSVGFGRALWSRQGGDGTEYVVAAIPLGGYVKMLDEREGEVVPAERHRAFNRQGVWRRIAIVAAGPVFNLVFTVLAFWVMFMVGVTDVRPVVGGVSGLADDAGLEPQDQIVAVEGEQTGSWTEVVIGLVGRALDRESVTLTLESPDGDRRTERLALDRLPREFNEERLLEAVGIEPWRPRLDPVVGEVSPDKPAAAAGLEAGDRITHVNGQPLEGWEALQSQVSEAGGSGQALSLTVSRGGETLDLEVRPELSETPEGERYLLGISARPMPDDVADRYFVTRRHGPLSAFGASFSETGRITSATLGMLGRMVTGSASTSGLSGPITIARYANEAAQLGLSRFLYFLAILSLSLAILNLLPIPVLDGGHLLYYLIELLKGDPLSERAQVVGQYVGLGLLAGLMGLAFYNDILRLITT